ncbi:tyrosine-protein phosphatase [uncultured Cohaesibacter sp.]|uniref:tyrosine-protein phosphatase n=1 Tax=uncultured Cohaesibacter sp. TaxID=1002546 RepID=UPI00293043CC|nr:tyrosine-protein phosphatase [uncultured Cohaesibacter sp.]
MSYSQHDMPKSEPKVAWTKRARKAVYRQIGHARRAAAEVSPPWLVRIFSPIYDYLDMIFADHGIFRVLYANRHQISPNAWRSAQPWPHQVRYYAKSKGIRTIVNLRGVRDCGSYRLEKKACEAHGIELRNDLKVYSRAAPSKEIILNFQSYFEALDHPILFHCKSGADRIGLVSTLYLHLIEDVPIEQAREQLSLRYGHFRHAKTGILDHFIDQYIEYKNATGMAFLDWVEQVYDEEALRQSFKSSRWSSVIADRILNRE